MKTKSSVIACLAFAAALGAAAQERLAVLDTVLPEGIDGRVVIPITEKIMEEFVRSKRFVVVDRAFIEKTLSEKEFSLSDLVADEGKLAEFGGFLKATYVVVSTVQRLETRYFISAKMIEVSTGVIVAQASADKDGTATVLIELAGTVGERLVAAALGESGGASSGPGVGVAAPAKPEKPAKPASARSAYPGGRFASAGAWVGIGLDSMAFTNGSGYYLDFYSLADLELYPAETVAAIAFGLDARFPLGGIFYAGAAAGYAEYYFEDASYNETWTWFLNLAGGAGLMLELAGWQAYLGGLVGFCAGGGEYWNSSGSFIEDYGWAGFPLGFELGADRRLFGPLTVGARLHGLYGWLESDSGVNDTDSAEYALSLRLGWAF